VALRRFATGERRGTPSVLLIVGLANPGAEFEGSRHNVGGDAVRLLGERRGVTFSHERRQRCLTATVASERGPVTLALPMTFMNETGAALPPLLRRTSLDDLRQLVVVHDELDLEPGRLQLKVGGGLAGHNGLRSIADTLGSSDFARLRVGIGKPPSKDRGADYVLQRLTGARREALRADVASAADALELLFTHDLDDAMRRVNLARG
jgi:peptidyl-tRNA hydrolase, PTH1 family